MDQDENQEENSEEFLEEVVVEEPEDAESTIQRLIDVVSNAKSMPLSASVLISRDEVLHLLELARDRFPEELRQARWMLKEREEFLKKTERDADEILHAARVRAERMVERTEIVRQAQHTAARTVERGREQARRLRHEAEDYCDQKLAAFEIVLERTAKTVQAGRDKLKITPIASQDEAHAFFANDGSQPDETADEVFFDQDDSEKAPTNS